MSPELKPTWSNRSRDLEEVLAVDDVFTENDYDWIYRHRECSIYKTVDANNKINGVICRMFLRDEIVILRLVATSVELFQDIVDYVFHIFEINKNRQIMTIIVYETGDLAADTAFCNVLKARQPKSVTEKENQQRACYHFRFEKLLT